MQLIENRGQTSEFEMIQLPGANNDGNLSEDEFITGIGERPRQSTPNSLDLRGVELTTKTSVSSLDSGLSSPGSRDAQVQFYLS